MDYVKPYGVVDSMLAGGALKLSLPPRQLVLRGMLAGAYLLKLLDGRAKWT